MDIFLMDVETRLDKFEAKLDSINDALISLARIEERVTTILKNNERMHTEVNELDERVGDLEQQSAVQGFTLSKGERLFWIGMTVFAGLLASGIQYGS